MNRTYTTEDNAKELADLLSSSIATSLLATHPNDVGARLAEHLDDNSSTHLVPKEWRDWWLWAGKFPKSWESLISFYNSTLSSPSQIISEDISLLGLPEELRIMILRITKLSLPRHPGIVSLTDPTQSFECSSWSYPKGNTAKGMSPKKLHEVTRMTGYILRLLEEIRERTGIKVRHIVDIGAGQGYLSHALYKSNLHVLALDSSSHQSSGAEERFSHINKNKPEAVSKGSLTFRTTWLGQSPSHQTHPGMHMNQATEYDTLEDCIGKWLSNAGCASQNEERSEPTAVVLVSLHACGSLTPTILRYSLAHRNKHGSDNSWFTAAEVVVGCCYNLLETNDFPLSNGVKENLQAHSSVGLTASHFQVAAQVPSQWLHSPEEKAASILAMRKVLFRSLISSAIQGNGAGTKKLGRLKDSLYESFDVFLSYAAQKLEFDEQQFRHNFEPDGIPLENSCIARRVEVLHAARCLLGPAVESLVILDRVMWLKEQLALEELGGPVAQDVHMINLFDQSTGSGRNIAIVLQPV